MKVLLSGNTAKYWADNSEESILKKFEEEGLRVVASLEENPDVVVVFNWCRDSQRIVSRCKQRPIRKVLVVTEPSVVIPQHQDKQVLAQFDELVLIGRDLNEKSIPYPQNLSSRHLRKRNRENKFVAVTANKLSFVRGELYSFRYRCYQEFGDVVVGGADWDMTWAKKLNQALRHLAGVVRAKERVSLDCLSQLKKKGWPVATAPEDKFDFMSNYLFALVIENSQEYVSEKLLDAICSGCIPVYVGGNPVAFGIPKQLFVSCEANIESVRTAMARVRGMNYDEWLVQVETWLEDPTNHSARSRATLNATIVSRVKESLP